MKTNSEYHDFYDCPRKWYYLFMQLKDRPYFSQPLYEGSGVHYALENLFAGDTIEDIKKRIDEYVQNNEMDIDYEKSEIIRHRIEAIAIGAFHYWKERRKKYKLVKAEWQLVADFPNSDGLTGKIDGVVLDTEFNKHYLLEYKTTSDPVENPSDPYWIRLNLDNQIRHYKYLVEKTQGFKIHGVIYAVFKKPKHNKLMNRINPETGKMIRVSKRKSESELECEARKVEALETLDQFRNRHIDMYSKNYDDYCFYKKITITNEDMENWKRNIIGSNAMIKACIDTNCFPQFDHNCKKYGSLCKFFNVCTGNQSITDPEFITKEAKHLELLE